MKIKKLTALFLVLIMLLSAVPIMASAASVDDLKYSISNGKVTITGCNETASGELVIPSKIDGYPVTSIGDWVFQNCLRLTSIKIPDSVTSIGYSVFAYCSSLTSITIDENNPVYDSRDNCNAIIETATNTLVYGCGNTIISENITSIGNYAFENCTSLTRITIPDSVTSIAYRAFGNCTSLTRITIPDSVTSIGGFAFYECTSLANITVDENNPVYDSRNNCNAIIGTATNTLIQGCQNTIIPDSVTSIGVGAFDGCASLTSITIPDSVVSIGDDAFYNCASLTSITIPDSVISIGYRAFGNCTSLTRITIPDSVTSIGGSAFDTCESLTSIIIPDSVTSIGDYAYASCTSLTSIIIPASVTAIGDGTFMFCEKLTNIIIPNNVTNIGNYAFHTCTSLTSITIPDGVTSIGTLAFYYCIGLTSITIPDSVTSIGDEAFQCCSGLTNITVNENNPVYDSRDNCNAIIETATNTLILGCQNTIIPDSVKSIGDQAFGYCDSLTSIEIPNGVTTIESNAFRACQNLSNIIIPNSVINIDDRAFEFCTINLCVQCYKNSYVHQWANQKGYLYRLIDSDIDIVWNALQIGTFEDEAKVICCNDSITGKIIIPDTYNGFSVTGIEYSAFSNIDGLIEIEIPDSVTAIGDCAFYGCSKLTNITIPSNVTNINELSFAYCTDLNDLIIPESVINIDNWAFEGCTGLNSVLIPKSVESIGQWAFLDCDNLTIYCYKDSYAYHYALDEDIKYELIDEPHTHTYTHISIPATCTVDGMEYDICSDCGDVINSKVISAMGHSWGEWKTVLEPTGTADGKAERKCSKCGDVESKIIAKLNVVKDDDTGIEIQFRDEFDSNIEIKVEEKFDGKSFQLLDLEYSNSKKQIFDITTYENGVKVQPDGKVTVRIPLPDGFGTKNIFVCYVDTESQNVTQIPAKVVDGFVEFTAEHFSEYAVVELSGKVEKVSVPDITVNYKDSAKITPNVTIDGDVKYTTSFTSSDTSVATVDKDGRITTLHKGTTTITCTVTDEYGNVVKDTCTVTVKFQWWQWIIWILLFGFLWY